MPPTAPLDVSLDEILDNPNARLSVVDKCISTSRVTVFALVGVGGAWCARQYTVPSDHPRFFELLGRIFWERR